MSNQNQISPSNVSNPNYEVLQTIDGKFVRKAIYQPFTSVVAETKEQKIKMMQLLDSNSELAIPMKDLAGAEIEIADVIMQPYDKIDEETGEIEYGVLSYLIEPDGKAYVTSSKSVYFTLNKIFTVFGKPHYGEGQTVTVKVIAKKGAKFMYNDLQVIG